MYEIVRLHYTSLKDTQQYKDYRFHLMNALAELFIICILHIYILNVHMKGGREAQIECPISEGAGMKTLESMNFLVGLKKR